MSPLVAPVGGKIKAMGKIGKVRVVFVDVWAVDDVKTKPPALTDRD